MTAPRALTLPPPYAAHHVAGGDIAEAAVARATDGAGTLVWSQRPGEAPGRLDFAVVLEPDEPMSAARRAAAAGHVALAEALAAHCPPERAVRLSPQGEVTLDTSRLGGIRIVAPGGVAEDAVPDWLVVAVDLIADRDHLDHPGTVPHSISLKEEGFEDPPAGVESFAAHLMLAFDRWRHEGWGWVARRASERLDRHGQYDDAGAWVNGPSRVALHAALRDMPWRGAGGPIL